ncbi:facilitated trehalose transporter Tret1-like isoform X1 [Homalodisca vitripennis]|uniref:facilitated trehalose transporter Tret1-like isoform X1 n=1 Tax=Homalodisca vitripennis TaxID=197043 RepID=UPI001EEC75D1|nr:facilitated trehalose transporter Tret1-like isoform X1 [Homalodisca vitripennis]
MNKGVFRQYLAAFIGSLAAMVAGTSYGWVTPLLSNFHDPRGDLPLTHEESSWVVALIEFGNLFTSIPTGILVDRWGRKLFLLGTAPIYIFSWVLILTTRSVNVLYFVRIIQGLAMGVIYTALPVYLAEISTPDIRGALTTFFEGMWYLGILLEYILGPFLSYSTFTLVTLTVPVVFLVTFVWVPESPYFLIMKGHEESAVNSLEWLRGSKNVREEFNLIKKTVNEEQNDNRSWKDLIATKSDVRALLIVEIVVLTKFMSGISAVLSYSSDMFASTAHSALTADHYTIIMGLLLLVTTILAGSLVDRAGRRPLLLISCLGCGLSEFSAGLYCFLDSKIPLDVSGYDWIFMLSIMTYCFIFSLGLGPLVNTLKGEIFPSSTKGFGSGLTTMTDTISCFVCLKIYQVITDSYGVFLNFWIFSAFSFFGAVVIYFIVPETKGKTFSEIQKSLGVPKHSPIAIVQYDFNAANEQIEIIAED